ncbi:aminotransferase class I/II-fold pyridoxal phosphate-dependent enzyme [Marinomonas spartinae]|uniref:aminotransferase class I/II-fold pyridoxal phosphate-dependent enzyme n=1 Tax=Marinomonas spartinae TaxID=1792290 RepID=UPI002D7E4694|nr:aminotransferase class I/II-fold pyridoxal phosphate-dependent enzyme [Marinomonas spartinae]
MGVGCVFDDVKLVQLSQEQLGQAQLDQVPPHHGGDLHHWQRKVGNDTLDWLDLSSACNREPWPVPEIDPILWSELPDQTSLLDQAAHFYGIRPIAIGAGSQHIIESLPLFLSYRHAKKRACVPRIGYQEHAFAWQKWGYELVFYDAVNELLEMEWSVAVVIQPNNPTGAMVESVLIKALVARAEQLEGHLMIDEAFIDPMPHLSVLNELEGLVKSESLFVLRSVGKFFGLAGARVGFVFCATSWQSTLRNLLGPWPVATPSLWLVEQALKDVVWQEKALLSLADRQKVFFDRIMPKLHTVFDSQECVITPLFFTWRLESKEIAEFAFSMLHQVGVHIRLGDGWVRVALPAMHEMAPLNHALVRLLKKAGGRELA